MAAVVATAAAVQVVQIATLYLVDKLDEREGKVAHLALGLALPLSVDVHLCHGDDVAHLQLERCLVVRVRDTGLLYSRQGW